MSTLDFGLAIHPTPRGGALPDMLATNELLLQAAVEHDLSAWFVDHFQVGAEPFLECFTFLAHTAGRFPGLRTGTLVLGQGYRNPALTAKMASTLQFLTGGRFTLGIGAGWKEEEYHAYGYPFPPAGRRIAELEEAVQIIRAMWEASPASFSGRYYTIANAHNEPLPDPVPTLMIGGAGERRTLPVVARYADWWNIDALSPEDYARKLALLRGHSEEIGRDPATLTPTYYAILGLARDPSTIARPRVTSRSNMYFLTGDPDEVGRQIERFVEVGVRVMQLRFLDFPRPDGLELFLDEVLPRFQSS